jgi:MFS family permease
MWLLHTDCPIPGSWRLCFYINLPLGAVTFIIVCFFVNLPQDPRYRAMSSLQLLRQLDIPGFALLVPTVVSILLALQWGGTQYAWKDARIIVLLVLFGLLSIAFVAVQALTPKTCTIPPSVFGCRSIGFTAWFALCTFSTFIVMVYYLPIWFQAIQRVSAVESGVRTVPLILGFIVCAVISGIFTEKLGYYTPMMIASSILLPIAIGLLSTFTPVTPSSQWIGYQALLGFGVGIGIQCPLVVIQTVLSEDDIPIGTALITLIQNLFGAVFVAIAQNVLKNQLKANLINTLPEINIDVVLSGGVTTILSQIPESNQEQFLIAYSKSITQTFYVGVGLSALSIIGSLGTEWKSVKIAKKENPAVQESPSKNEKNDIAQTG